ncbi:phage portal protein [Sphingomonas sp. 1P06PA]|uniref:phage portal protein n=1 Tax=Sphingomonas sp. 1P06PA TaxID=554121 RepID=UPI0039A52B97
MAQPLLDRVIGAVAPGWALDRERARLRLAMVHKTRGEYDGATQGRRASSWRRSLRDANGELTPQVMNALRGVARDLVRNNPFAARGVSAIANNVVGTGITFQVYRNGVIDPALNDIARRHFDTMDCDAAGRHDLYGLQLQAARTIVESGAALVRRRWRRRQDGYPLPFQMQVLEPDYIDQGKHGPLPVTAGKSGGFLINGIQFDPLGEREGYWLYSGHPGSAWSTTIESKLIPARDLAHVFRADRPEQEHGATWLAPIVLRMKDFAEYEDAQLLRQKLAACFAVFKLGDASNDPPIPDPNAPDDAGLEMVEPGMIYDVPEGRDIKFADPPGVEGYGEYSKVSLRAVSAGLNVPYEVLSGDLSSVSFISGRLGLLEFQRSLATWQWNMFIPQFCGAVEQWFLESLPLIGEDPTGVTMRWTPPRREMMDPSSEVPATRNAIRSGLMTLSEAVRERGIDPDTHFDEWKSDADTLDRLGLVFDADPRKVTSAGNPSFLADAPPRT